MNNNSNKITGYMSSHISKQNHRQKSYVKLSDSRRVYYNHNFHKTAFMLPIWLALCEFSNAGDNKTRMIWLYWRGQAMAMMSAILFCDSNTLVNSEWPAMLCRTIERDQGRGRGQISETDPDKLRPQMLCILDQHLGCSHRCLMTLSVYSSTFARHLKAFSLLRTDYWMTYNCSQRVYTSFLRLALSAEWLQMSLSRVSCKWVHSLAGLFVCHLNMSENSNIATVQLCLVNKKFKN